MDIQRGKGAPLYTPRTNYAQRIKCVLCITYLLGLFGLIRGEPGVNVPGRCPDIAAQPEIVWLTVFVHGIINPGPHFSVSNIVRFFKDNLENTQYAKSVRCIRGNDFFYQAQAMGPLGLHYIDYKEAVTSSAQKNNGSVAMAYLFNEMHECAGAGQMDNRYYTFGWSGLLSPRARYQAAKELFEALDKEVHRLRELGFDPKIRVIGYSHGGNVVLNLGAVHQREHSCSSLSIDELILLGTPIHSDTDYLINDSLFKYIYHIYSSADRVQKIDCLSFKRFFSGRTFKSRKGFTLPDKLVQIRLKVTVPRCDVSNYEKYVQKTGDFGNSDIVSGRSRLLADVSPGHGELWFFGWTAHDYRFKYPLYPLPTIALLPFITHTMAYYRDMTCCHNHFVVDVRPAHEHIIVKKKCMRDVVGHVIPFVSRDRVNSIKKRLFCFAPKDYTREEYDKQTQQGIREAHAFF